MKKPRPKRMLLVVVATLTAPEAVACSSSGPNATGFYGDIAYDGGYELGDASPMGFRDAEPDVDAADAADAADAPDDAGDAGDTGD